MNAQYFTEIELGNPPQSVCVLTNFFIFTTEFALNSSKSFSTPGMVYHRYLHRYAKIVHLAQAIYGFLAHSARLLHASSTPSMNRQTRRLTKPTDPSFPSNMALAQWKALFLMTFSKSAILPSRIRILQRLSKNLASHLLSESRSKPYQ
jgi:hypothetical protein